VDGVYHWAVLGALCALVALRFANPLHNPRRQRDASHQPDSWSGEADLARGHLTAGAKKVTGKGLVLPVDHLVADKVEPGAQTKVVDHIEAGWIGVDIGPKTRLLFAEKLRGAKTAFWNGPMGVFEIKGFDEGTRAMARALAEITGHGAVTIIGGGDSAAAVREMGFDTQVTHVSTGGGAALEMVEGKFLPGLAALDLKIEKPS